MSNEAYNAYMREYMAKRRALWRAWAYAELGGECVKCGSTEGLQFDHIDPSTKAIEVPRLLHASRKKFEAEVRKCQLLCTPHHKEKTRSEVGVPHGGGASGRKNCPCTPCRERKAEYMKSYKAARQGSSPGRAPLS